MAISIRIGKDMLKLGLMAIWNNIVSFWGHGLSEVK
jgi:hypothetical protein